VAAVLIAGDVHGDLERLFSALKPYPADAWRTIFLGDLVDYGAFGVGALRYARDRANTEVLLGNHEVAMLWALRDPSRVAFWIGIGGQPHDLDELAKDKSLLLDRTLVQHCGNDSYGKLVEKDDADPVESINRRVHDLLESGGEADLWDMMSGRNIFAMQPDRLERWLELTGSRRVVFGHSPHRGARPEVYFGGKALNFDGGFSRHHRLFRRLTPTGATVAPLPD
jgi:hypothetical protein